MWGPSRRSNESSNSQTPANFILLRYVAFAGLRSESLRLYSAPATHKIHANARRCFPPYLYPSSTIAMPLCVSEHRQRHYDEWICVKMPCVDCLCTYMCGKQIHPVIKLDYISKIYDINVWDKSNLNNLLYLILKSVRFIIIIRLSIIVHIIE